MSVAVIAITPWSVKNKGSLPKYPKPNSPNAPRPMSVPTIGKEALSSESSPLRKMMLRPSSAILLCAASLSLMTL